MAKLSGDNDAILGIELGICGRKFKPVIKQDFVKIEGPCSAKITKEIKDVARVNFFKEKNPQFNFYEHSSYFFEKAQDLIAEPANGNFPDYKGGEKHAAKAYGHTPKTEYKIEAWKDGCAICYIDRTRQKRSQQIKLVSAELTGFKKV